MEVNKNDPVPMTFAGGPTYMVPYLKDTLKKELFSQKSLFNINSNNKQFWQILDRARSNIRSILNVPQNHQIWYLSGGCHLQFAGLPLNFLGEKQNATANYTVCGHFSRLAFNEAKKYCDPKCIIEPKKNEKGEFYLPDHYEFDQNAMFTHFVENESVEGIYFKDQLFPIKEGIPLFNDCSSSFLTRPIDWSKNDMVYAHAQKNCGISGLTIMILNQRSLQTNPRSILPQICSFQNYKKKNGINTDMSILPIYGNYVFTEYLKGQGGLQKNAYEKRSKRLYEVIDKYQIYKPRVVKQYRSPITVTWNIEDPQILQKCMDEGAKNKLHDFKGHRAIGGLRASLFCPIPDEAVYRLADFLQEFAQKYE